MIDTERYIILENWSYETRAEAQKQIQEVYSNLLGVIPLRDDDEKKWYIVRVKTSMF